MMIYDNVLNFLFLRKLFFFYWVINFQYNYLINLLVLKVLYIFIIVNMTFLQKFLLYLLLVQKLLMQWLLGCDSKSDEPHMFELLWILIHLRGISNVYDRILLVLLFFVCFHIIELNELYLIYINFCCLIFLIFYFLNVYRIKQKML